MGIESGAVKYFLMTYLVPGPYYIFGGSILWFMDVVNVLGAKNAQKLIVAAAAAYFKFPTSVGDFLFQHFVGAFAATALWFIGMIRYMSR
jgi:HD-like signal output (HDOD) protein